MTPKQLIGEAGELISLPEVCVRVNQLAHDPKSSATEIGQIISQDTALSARLLKLVNSAFYGFPGPIDTVSRAITIIGTRELCDLAMMTAFCGVFTGIPISLVNMETFWRSGLSSGILARRLARSSKVLHPERLFVMGVLHDVGRLVMYQQLPAESRDILLISQGRDDLIIAAEQEVLGFTHGEVGYELAKAWRLPESIAAVMRWHHQPELAETSQLECYLTCIANSIADALNQESEPSAIGDRVSPAAWQITGLSADICPTLITDLGSEIRELYAILMGRSDSLTTA